MTAKEHTELYRVKFRIAATGTAHHRDPVRIEAWVVRTPGPAFFKPAAESAISNPLGDLSEGSRKSSAAEPDALRKPDSATINKEPAAVEIGKKNRNRSGGVMLANADGNAQILHRAQASALPPEAADSATAGNRSMHDHIILNTSIGIDDVRTHVSPEQSIDKAKEVQQQVDAEADIAVKFALPEDTPEPAVPRWTESTNKPRSQAAQSRHPDTPLSAKSIPLGLLPPEGDGEEFQAILHVHLVPENVPCRLDVSTVPLDSYTRMGKKQQVLRVDYYRPPGHVLSGDDTLTGKKAGAGLGHPLATTLFAEASLQADDIAVITRVYFVTHISAARRVFQMNLIEAASLMAELDKEEAGPETAGSREEHGACREVWKLAAQQQPEKYHAQPGMREWLEDKVALAAERLHHVLGGGVFVRNLTRLFRLLCFFGVVSALLLIWAPYWELPFRNTLGSLTSALALVAFAVFTFYALNIRTLNERAEEMLLEWRTRRFADLVGSLGSANANVAASRVHVFWPSSRAGDARRKEGVELCAPWIPETLLTGFDEQLHIKERLTSLERVLKAHDTQTAEKMHHIEEDRATVRRTVTAGASGVFVGLATSEVGEMVLRYLHVTNGSDQNSLMYWLTEQREAITVMRAHPVTSAVATGHSPLQEYAHRFHHPELFAHSVLLTITLVFSLIAAWIAMRKPAHEQTAGHGHH